MLRPEQMHQVSIIVAKDQLTNLLAFAGTKKLFHLVEITEEKIPDGAQRYDAAQLLARSSTVKNRIATVIATLPLGDASPERIEAPLNNLETLSKFLDDETAKLEQSVRQLENAEGKLQQEREQTSELSRLLSGLQNVGVSLDAIAGGSFLAGLAGEASQESIASVQKELDEITYGNLIFAITSSTEKTQSFLAIFPDAFREDAKQAVAAIGAKLAPPWTDLPSDPKRAKEEVDSRLGEIESSSKELDHQKETIAKDYGPRIKTLAALSEIFEARTKALAGSSTTDSTTLLEAWVPKNQVQTLIEGASVACDGLVSVQFEPTQDTAHHSDGEAQNDGKAVPPTLVKIPGWTQPLQSIIDNFGMPSYGETNPLPFMILTFPLIYGLMFGDIGEGLLFLAFGLFLLNLKRRKVKVFEIGQIFVNGAELVVMLGIAVTIFGFVFGDIFGFESQAVLGIPAIFSPTQGAFASPPNIGNLIIFMVFILFFGVAHFLSGLAINVYNKIRNREYRHALLGPVSWAWFYSSFIYAAVLVVQSGFKFSVLLKNPLVILSVAIPLGLMAYGEGGLHVMEAFIGAGSNTLSYLRIWALNLADFAIKFAFLTSFGIAGVVIGNVLVMILEGLIVFVQTLRLHWVEWFGKFYEGTGHPFAPYQEPVSWTVSQ